MERASGVAPGRLRNATLAATLALAAAVNAAPPAVWPPLTPLDDARLATRGLRVVRGAHAELVTDLPPSEEIDGLTRLVDAAVPQWAERFGTPAAVARAWRVRVCLIGEEARFAAAGLMPAGGRRFPNGLSLGHETWARDQPTDYYRRCLVLHEATHSYMQTTLGGCGPGWFMEGLAELCGAHAWDAGVARVELAAMPSDRRAAPGWGRVRLVREAIDAGGGVSLAAVRRIDNTTPLEPTKYAWVWAAAKLLDAHPRYRERFRALAADVLADDFAGRFDRAFAADRRQLEQEWRLFAATLVYGHDIAREAIDFRDAVSLDPGARHALTIAAGRGWQPAGVRVEAGRAYDVTAAGRFVIARDPDGAAWPCEPGGVTLAYHNGRPLGELLAVVDGAPDAFVRPMPVGLAGRLTPTAAGALYLRLNDTPARLAENSGVVTVRIRAE